MLNSAEHEIFSADEYENANLYGLQYSIFADSSIGKIYDLFRYRKEAWTCLYTKQL